jgi:hypothetical protein
MQTTLRRAFYMTKIDAKREVLECCMPCGLLKDNGASYWDAEYTTVWDLHVAGFSWRPIGLWLCSKHTKWTFRTPYDARFIAQP